MSRIISLPVKLDDKGYGKVFFKSDGYLEAVIIRRNISFPSIKIFSQDIPEYIVFEPTAQIVAQTYFPRVQCHGTQGKDLEHYDKIYMIGNFAVEIRSGIPDSVFDIKLVVSNG